MDVAEEVPSLERSYVFEERLRTGNELRDKGNQLFKQGEYRKAVKWYAAAMYHAEFDLMQMHDLNETHKEMAYAVQVPCKLNYVASALKIISNGETMEAIKVDDEEEPRSPLDHCGILLEEILKAGDAAERWEEPSVILPLNRAKTLFRKAQVLRERGDLQRSKEVLAQARKQGAPTKWIREEMERTKLLEQAERQRERSLFHAMIQDESTHAIEERRKRDAKPGLSNWQWIILPLFFSIFAYVLRTMIK